MKDKDKYSEPAGPTVTKNSSSGGNHHSSKEAPVRSSSKQAKNSGGGDKKDAKKGATDDDKNYEVGIVEIASNLSDLSGSTGDVDSNPDVKQVATPNGKEFEILIQAKHAEACKAMGVRAV